MSFGNKMEFSGQENDEKFWEHEEIHTAARGRFVI